MRYIDVFNGDADGICSLVQLRLAEPRESVLVTGIKRDIQLLSRVETAAEDVVTVLDISMQKNMADLQRILQSGARVFYADHHRPGDIPEASNLDAHIDMSSTKCTALIVDALLESRFHLWAITAAFGDNLEQIAKKLADDAGLNQMQQNQLRDLGIYLNYNGYGASLDDLFFTPDTLFRACVKYDSPLDFIAEEKTVFETLESGYQQDMARANAISPDYESEHVAMMLLPDAAWARRVSGVWGNELANKHPQRAHLILTPKGEAAYQVSIRAPLNQREGADKIASQFETGGGRAGAAGVNALPEDAVSRLIELAESQYG